jgi:hypothetical protein
MGLPSSRQVTRMLKAWSAVDKRKSKVIEPEFFGGLNVEETVFRATP